MCASPSAPRKITRRTLAKLCLTWPARRTCRASIVRWIDTFWSMARPSVTLISRRDIFLLIYLARPVGRGRKKTRDKKPDSADCNFAACLLITANASSPLITKYRRFAPEGEVAYYLRNVSKDCNTNVNYHFRNSEARREREREVISLIIGSPKNTRFTLVTSSV